MKLYVGNLAYSMTESELETIFSNHGRVKTVKIINDHFTRQSKCFGYIEMQNHKDACKAMEYLHGKTVNDRQLIVKEARSRDERQGLGW